MPGDTNRRYKTITAGTAAIAVANSTLIVMADFEGSDAGVYATGVIQFPASNTITTWTWYAMATPSSALLPLYDASGAAVTTTVAGGGGVYPIPVSAFGCYAVAGQGVNASTFTAGLMT
jgi:hypothetical protein